MAGATEAGPERARGGTHRVEDTAANLTGDSKGAERRRGGGPTALGRRIELGRATLVGDVDGARGRWNSSPTARWGGGGRRHSGMAAAASRRHGGSRGRWRRDADQENHLVLGKGEEEGRYRGGGLLSRVEPRPGTKGPFVPGVPGEATTRDKRTFCLGSWLHPEKKVFLGGPGKFPARGPPLVPGGSTTRDKRGPFSLNPAKSYVCFCFFLLLF